MTTPTVDRETILQIVHQWPISEQVALADAILAEARTATPSRSPLLIVPSKALRGILANNQPPPSDEEVARLLEEERMKKYGG